MECVWAFKMHLNGVTTELSEKYTTSDFAVDIDLNEACYSTASHQTPWCHQRVGRQICQFDLACFHFKACVTCASWSYICMCGSGFHTLSVLCVSFKRQKKISVAVSFSIMLSSSAVVCWWPFSWGLLGDFELFSMLETGSAKKWAIFIK